VLSWPKAHLSLPSYTSYEMQISWDTCAVAAISLEGKVQSGILSATILEEAALEVTLPAILVGLPNFSLEFSRQSSQNQQLDKPNTLARIGRCPDGYRRRTPTARCRTREQRHWPVKRRNRSVRVDLSPGKTRRTTMLWSLRSSFPRVSNDADPLERNDARRGTKVHSAYDTKAC
jgi:hypothetical protein